MAFTLYVVNLFQHQILSQKVGSEMTYAEVVILKLNLTPDKMCLNIEMYSMHFLLCTSHVETLILTRPF